MRSPRSPRSPHGRGDRLSGHYRDYFSEDHHIHHHHRRDPPYYSPSSPMYKSHRHRSESYEATGRSVSLTNAATPIRPVFDTQGGAEAGGAATDPHSVANSQRSRSLSSGAQLYAYGYGGGHGHGHGYGHHSHHYHGHYPQHQHPPLPQYQGPSRTPSGSSQYPTPVPYFMRASSEDIGLDDQDPYRGSGGMPAGGMVAHHPGMMPDGMMLMGAGLSKRKYSCTHPGCNKRFTTR